MTAEGVDLVDHGPIADGDQDFTTDSLHAPRLSKDPPRALQY